MPKLSQYELDREANIARNLAIIQGLALHHSSSLLGISKKAKPQVAAQPLQPEKRKRKDEEEGPKRQSVRLKKLVIDPNEDPAQRKRREAEEKAFWVKQEEEQSIAQQQVRAAKKARYRNLVLHQLAPQDPEDISTLNHAFKGVITQPYCRRVGEPDAFVYSGDDKRERREVAELAKKLQSLKVVARADVNQNRIYSAAYHPEISKDLIFFGDQHGELGIWDARAAPEEVADKDGDVQISNRVGGKYWQLQLHWPATSKSSISSIKFDPVNAHNVYTTSYDCTIGKLSLPTEVATEVYTSKNGAPITHADLTPLGHEMWISDNLGGVTHLDLREGKSQNRRYELSNSKIGCISIHPTRPNFILTASNDHTMKVWDVRKLRNLLRELTGPPELHYNVAGFDRETVAEFINSKKGFGVLRGECLHDKSCRSAYWDPRGKQVVSTSYDNTLRLWDLDGPMLDNPAPFKSFKPFSQIRHYWAKKHCPTSPRAQWSPNPDAYPHFTIGNMKQSLDIFSGRGDLLARLSDASRITTTQAVTCSHPDIIERAASGNGSGRRVLWAPADVGHY